jgi:hypothetical protein
VKYEYTGETPLFYPMYWPDNSNLEASKGTVADFPEDPPPGPWAPVEDEPKTPKKVAK